MLTYWAVFHCFSLMVKLCIEWGVAHLCNLLCLLSCLSDWKTVSVHVFGMKHLWDIHLLLLVLLHLLGAATSQVNPGLCCHQRANCVAHSPVLWFRCLHSSLRLQWDHIWEFVNSIKKNDFEFCLAFLGSVLQSRLRLIQMSDKCSFVGAVWSPLSGLASLIQACTPFSSSPSTVRVVFVMSMKRPTNNFFLQGTRVAAFSG